MAHKTFVVTQSPTEKYDWRVNWIDLVAPDDAILSSDWTVDAGMTDSDEDFGDDYSLIFLTGGLEGEEYTHTNTVITAGGRTGTAVLIMRIRAQY